MKWAVRILGGVALATTAAGGGAYVLLPKDIAAESQFVVNRPLHSVVTWMATTPDGDAFAEGVTETLRVRASDHFESVLALEKGKADVRYELIPTAEGVQIKAAVKRDLGGDMLARANSAAAQAALQATLEAGVGALKQELEALPTFDFAALKYDIVDVQARPFYFFEAQVSTAQDDIVDAMRQSLPLLDASFKVNNVEKAGPLIAVENNWVEGKSYSFSVGFPYKGEVRKQPLLFKTGETPAGKTIRVLYTGGEDQVIPVYDQVETLIKAARLKRSGPSFEIYMDDVNQPGGSRNREIYHLIEGDVAALEKIPAQ